MKLNNILKLSLCLILLVIVTLIIPTNKVEASSRKSISKATISSISTQYYTGKSIKPSITVKYKGKKLTKNKDYKVSYSKNKNVGTAKIKITGKGKYKGTKTKTFKIAVSKVSGFSKKTVTTSSITLKWSKPKKSITGYEIYMATSKNGKYSKIKTITNSKTTSYKKTGLKDNKTYYFKLRAYKTISKKKYYSSYTSKISIKTSKKSSTSTISGRLSLAKKEAKRVVKKIIKPGMSDYDKAYAIFDYLLNNAERQPNQSTEAYKKNFGNEAYAALVLKKAACSGFAKAVTLLCDEVGLKSKHINKGEWNHQWNEVYIKGRGWIVLDAQGGNFDSALFLGKANT